MIMKSDRFSIDPGREQFRHTGDLASVSVQKWDYFLNPDRFFARLFSDDLPVLIPFLIFIASLIIPIVFIEILAIYLNTFVPFLSLPGSGVVFILIKPTLVIWTVVFLYFMIFSGEPVSPSAESHSWGLRGARIFAAIGFAIIPIIVLMLIGGATLLLFLPGIAIVPPPTTAYEAYQQADTEWQRTFDQTFTSMEPSKVPADNVAEQSMQRIQNLLSARNAAGEEATLGLQQVRSQLLQNPTLDFLKTVMPVVSFIVLLWVGVLLMYGIHHALDISLIRSAALVGILVVVDLFVQFIP
jgi:hypothetical protein